MVAKLDSCRGNNNKNTERRLETPRKKGGLPHRMTRREVLPPRDN